jgi:hypothetical protein
LLDFQTISFTECRQIKPQRDARPAATIQSRILYHHTPGCLVQKRKPPFGGSHTDFYKLVIKKVRLGIIYLAKHAQRRDQCP